MHGESMYGISVTSAADEGRCGPSSSLLSRIGPLMIMGSIRVSWKSPSCRAAKGREATQAITGESHQRSSCKKGLAGHGKQAMDGNISMKMRTSNQEVYVRLGFNMSVGSPLICWGETWTCSGWACNPVKFH